MRSCDAGRSGDATCRVLFVVEAAEGDGGGLG
jgi:hypothetical protein